MKQNQRLRLINLLKALKQKKIEKMKQGKNITSNNLIKSQQEFIDS